MFFYFCFVHQYAFFSFLDQADVVTATVVQCSDTWAHTQKFGGFYWVNPSESHLKQSIFSFLFHY